MLCRKFNGLITSNGLPLLLCSITTGFIILAGQWVIAMYDIKDGLYHSDVCHMVKSDLVTHTVPSCVV